MKESVIKRVGRIEGDLMERLTEWDCDNQWYKPKKGVSHNAIHTKLGEYEETGLEPEEVAEYKKFEDNIIQVYHCTLSHVISLLEKEKQGRLIELPCKVGSVIYAIVLGKIEERTVSGFAGGGEVEFIYTVFEYESKGYCTTFDIEELGKSVFLTKEEAEQALSK